MYLQGETDDLGFCLSFSCYFSDSNLTASAAARVICELKQEKAAQFYEFSDVDEDEFEFSSDLSDEQVSGKQIDDFGFIFSVENSAVEETGDAASPISVQLLKSSVDEQGSYLSSSFSSSEADENECNCKPSGMWSVFEKCKKSCSIGSHGSSSKREGEESVLFLRSKKAAASKKRRKLKTASFHEVFYVQKRAEQKSDKMKSFLPYKQDLLGFFVNIKRSGNKK